jgi:mono/diheme cytochrome c family protein
MPAADTPSSDNCIACHTNQALLQQLAVEPEEVKSELAGGEG